MEKLTYISAKREEFSDEAIEVFYNENADWTPVDPSSDGHFFRIETLSNMVDPEFYDEEDLPCNEALDEIKCVIKEMQENNADMFYLYC